MKATFDGVDALLRGARETSEAMRALVESIERDGRTTASNEELRRFEALRLTSNLRLSQVDERLEERVGARGLTGQVRIAGKEIAIANSEK